MKKAGIFFGAEIDDRQNHGRPVPGSPAYGDGGLPGTSAGFRTGARLNEPG